MDNSGRYSILFTNINTDTIYGLHLSCSSDMKHQPLFVDAGDTVDTPWPGGRGTIREVDSNPIGRTAMELHAGSRRWSQGTIS